SMDKPEVGHENGSILCAARPRPAAVLPAPCNPNERNQQYANIDKLHDTGRRAVDEPDLEHGIRAMVPLRRWPRKRGKRQRVVLDKRSVGPSKGLHPVNRPFLQQPSGFGDRTTREWMDVQLQRVPNGER